MMRTDVDFASMAARYRSELLDNVLPFWLEKSQDKEHGGYFTCLDRDGSVFDTDKFVWLQGREVWMFSMLYNSFKKDPAWLECAAQGARFLLDHGHDGNFDFYFSLTRELSEKLAREGLFETDRPVLSMGMSGSWIPAVREGATMVRVGRALFRRENDQP